jgi:opacity protein-like surface antigen
MKSILLFLLLVSIHCNAQYVSVFGGANYSKINYNANFMTASVASSDFFDNPELNFTLGIGYEKRINDFYGVDFRFQYSNNSSSMTDKNLMEWFYVHNVSVKTVLFNPLIKLYPFRFDKFEPYLGFGPNMYYLLENPTYVGNGYNNDNFYESVKKLNFGLTAAAGIGYKLNDNLMLKFELNYQKMLTHFMNTDYTFVQSVTPYLNAHKAQLDNYNTLIGITYKFINH